VAFNGHLVTEIITGHIAEMQYITFEAIVTTIGNPARSTIYI